MFVGKVPGAQLAEMKAAYGELSMAVKTRRETYGDGYAEARLRYGLQAGQQQNFAELREAYANAYLGPLNLRLGKQIIVWGRADALNPTNNLMPFDIRVRSPIEDDRRLGNVAARASLHLGPVRLEGVWIPLYLPSELPDLPMPQYVSFGDAHEPARRAAQHPVGGAASPGAPGLRDVRLLCARFRPAARAGPAVDHHRSEHAVGHRLAHRLRSAGPRVRLFDGAG